LPSGDQEAEKETSSALKLLTCLSPDPSELIIQRFPCEPKSMAPASACGSALPATSGPSALICVPKHISSMPAISATVFEAGVRHGYINPPYLSIFLATLGFRLDRSIILLRRSFQMDTTRVVMVPSY